mmetsp:Transcript_22996/g.48200  ORF Transcript_22996/g.48200 Transcript_22996/m.48200 type:complete len:118 (+) Transcript_22996:114-467(+)
MNETNAVFGTNERGKKQQLLLLVLDLYTKPNYVRNQGNNRFVHTQNGRIVFYLASRSKSDRHHSHGPRKSHRGHVIETPKHFVQQAPSRRNLNRAIQLGDPLSQIGTHCCIASHRNT